MRDLLSKLDAIVSETALKDPADLAAKQKALDDLEADPVASKDPEISAAIDQRRADLEREAKSKGMTEAGIDFDKIRADAAGHMKKSIDKQSDDRIAKLKSDREKEDEPFMAQVGRKIVGGVKGAVKGAAKGFSGKESAFEVGDDFGISLSEDFEIGTEIIGFAEDGIIVDLDETALNYLQDQGFIFLDGELEESLEEGKGPCWIGYKQIGMKNKGGKQVPNCVKEDEIEESGLQYYTGVKKHGEEYMKRAAEAGRKGASQEELGRLKDRYSKAEKNKPQKEDHGPENPDAPVNYGEYDREGDMAKDQLRTINSAAEELYAILDANENLPEWVQKKITLAVDYIDTARDYMKSNKYEEGVAEGDVDEAKYQGREVPLGKKMAGDVKKSKVYVRKPNGNIVKVNFGDKKMRIKKSNPARRKSFRARHNCKNPGPRWKARYWSCRSW